LSRTHWNAVAFSSHDEAGQFLLIITDPLDDRIQEVINPIDTFARKNKFAADYIKDKMNLVSIRDDNKAGKINFYIHFDRNSGECTGELKGVANITSANTAVYQQQGDACSIQFNFSSSSVSLKENQECGAHRGGAGGAARGRCCGYVPRGGTGDRRPDERECSPRRQ
jgi:hypothetical protein